MRIPGSARLAITAVAAAGATATWAQVREPREGAIACDERLASSFKPDALTTVVAVKLYRAGDPLVLTEAVTARTAKAGSDLCLVKLNVGPGNPGPADAPSTSKGIGIEVWLPTRDRWNGRVHAIGGNGWSGGNAGSQSLVSNPMGASAIAAGEGAVVSTSDSGHSGQRPELAGVPSSDGAFGLDPDGRLSAAQWRDHSTRSAHEQAVKTKALAEFYYGRAPSRAYFDGVSQGGRQGYMLAQRFPDDYDGIVANYPAINWTRWNTAQLYRQLVYLRDLGGHAPTEAQEDLLSLSAIRACDSVGGEHLGFIMDPSTCRYDPETDPEVLCKSEGGRNRTADCVTRRQARAVNKIWYGMTSDGSVPSPAIDNGWDKKPVGVRRWYGPSRAASLNGAPMRRLFPMTAPTKAPAGAKGETEPTGDAGSGSDMIALELQNPTIADPSFRNATGNGQALWRSLSYEQLANAFDRGVALQATFNDLDANDPDLSAFKARGGKLLTWYGLDDAGVVTQGTIQYYRDVAARMGGFDAVRRFYKLYLVPGIGHGAGNGTANAQANPPVVDPLLFYRLMVDWVEKGAEPPHRLDIASPEGSANPISQPICAYPEKAVHVGGSPRLAASYACR